MGYVAGKQGEYIIYALIAYVTKPSNKRKRRAFQTGDERKIHREVRKTPAEIAEEIAEKEKVFDLVRGLSPNDFVLIALYFGHDKTYTEVGKVFDRSDRWASGRIKEILKGLRKEMER